MELLQDWKFIKNSLEEDFKSYIGDTVLDLPETKEYYPPPITRNKERSFSFQNLLIKWIVDVIFKWASIKGFHSSILKNFIWVISKKILSFFCIEKK